MRKGSRVDQETGCLSGSPTTLNNADRKWFNKEISENFVDLMCGKFVEVGTCVSSLRYRLGVSLSVLLVQTDNILHKCLRIVFWKLLEFQLAD